MELSVRNAKGEVTDTVEVSDALFGVPMNRAVVHQALVMYELNKRQGTHATKTRAQVSGGGRKPWRQKHTGRARHGSIRAPQWRHGGVVFGPHPRDYRLRMSRRVRHLALKCVLSEKVRGGKLILLDRFSIEWPSTKSMAEILGNLGIGASALLVTHEPQENVVLSARNLKKIWTLPVSLINAAEVLRRDSLVMTPEAARRAEELWAVEGPRRNRTRTSSPEAGQESEG